MNNTVTIDVREDIRTGREPFSRIMNAAAALQADEQLLVIAPFEPVPLFTVLEKQGFGHTSKPVAAGDWEVCFMRQFNPSLLAASTAAVAPTTRAGDQLDARPLHRRPADLKNRESDRDTSICGVPVLKADETSALRAAGRDSELTPVNLVEVDARGLEPPQPMIRILETLAGLPDGARLHARTDRRPMHLYAQLEERGFIAETKEQPDGSFLTYVRRR